MMENKVKLAVGGGIIICISLVLMVFSQSFNAPFLPYLIVISLCVSGLPIPKKYPVLRKIAFFFSLILYLNALYCIGRFLHLDEIGAPLNSTDLIAVILHLTGAILITTVATIRMLERPPYSEPSASNKITPTGFFQACLIPLKKYKEFKGRAARKEFWGFILLMVLILTPLNLIAVKVFNDNPMASSSREVYIWYIAAQLFLLTPSWAAFTRRMHDIGRSGWMCVLNLIPGLGYLIIIGYLCQKGDPNPNQYGNHPYSGQDTHAQQAAVFTISNDPFLFNLPLICKFLREESYWAKDRSIADIEKSIEHSLCFGGYLDGKQIAFARVVTDRTTFYYLADVFLLPEFQNNGYGTKLVEHILDSLNIDSMRGLLFTKTAQEFYTRHGFSIPSDEERGHIMIRREINND